MAVKPIGSRNNRFIGLSTDTKPTDGLIYAGATFYESDTGILFIYDSASWLLKEEPGHSSSATTAAIQVLMEPTTAAAETEPVEIVGLGMDGRLGYRLPVTLYGLGTFGSDVISLEYYDGFQWVGFKVGGIAVELNANSNILSIYAPTRIRLRKKTTTKKIGVGMSSVAGSSYIAPMFEGYMMFEDGTNHLVAENGDNIVQNNG